MLPTRLTTLPRLSAMRVYVIMAFVSDLIFSLIFTVDAVYQITIVGLNPLQLVLVGTALEVTVFLFEIPTGALADVKSRRLSIIIGYVLVGLGFILQGSLPSFGAILLAQLVWGLGYTFTSGATQAWIADEAGQQGAESAFLRGAQASNVGGLVAVPLSIWIGLENAARPIVLGGAGLMLLSLFLAFTMPEEGFHPTPSGRRRTVTRLKETMASALQLTRRQPILLALLAIAFFYGLYSEGLDRLWTPHLLRNVGLPSLAAGHPVILFGLVRLVHLMLSLFAVEYVRRREARGLALPLGKTLRIMSLLIMGALVAFGLARELVLALVLYWGIQVLRYVHSPLQDAWVNSHVDDPQVRATMFSALSQTDAIGQIAGGPLVGMIGNISIRAALMLSGLLLSPVAHLYKVAEQRSLQTGNPPCAAD